MSQNMEHTKFCQSCSMPLDSQEMMGTEKDGSKNQEYCKYCYQDGHFINPGMTLNEMKTLVKSKMEEMKIAPGIIKLSLDTLPHLKRWNNTQLR
ncbi:zinc ribbon domain-containing protein [Chitinophagaceae bacterium MMS25-I14]